MAVDLLVLNYNGQALLAECLPSVVAAARAAPVPTRVWVIDNSSTDDSVAYLAANFPDVAVTIQPNVGLCSFNRVLSCLASRVAVLLNNDVLLEPDCLAPLLEPLLAPEPERTTAPPLFLTAPRLYRFDRTTYEGEKTAVRWRHGLVEATAFFPGHEQVIEQPSQTACAGAMCAVDRLKFLELGGFDPIYLPGRLEDLDLVYRAYQAGWQTQYVPASVAYHRGGATFEQVYSAAGNRHLAWRNTLLFQWSNLRDSSLRQRLGCAARVGLDLVRAPLVAAADRFAFCRAYGAALWRWYRPCAGRPDRTWDLEREREFFALFEPAELAKVLPRETESALNAETEPEAARSFADHAECGEAVHS